MKNTLTNLRYDLPASIVVFFVALPLCLGIALASGTTLFSGIISGIIGGVVVGIASGSRLGVSGPAAGLVVIVLSYISSLGSFENFLTALVFAGVIQAAMGYIRLGTIAYYIPTSVIKGMLAGIGVIIIVKQLPHALGYDFGVNDFEQFLSFGSLINLEQTLLHLTPLVVMISIISMTILILWDGILAHRNRFFKVIPGPLIIVVVGIILNSSFNLDAHQIVQIPVVASFVELLRNFTLPNFDMVRSLETYKAALVIALVASIESLLSVEATDKLDPARHTTNTNRELKAQGLGNIICGMIGGLPITQVIVRSSANISFGARSKTSTIVHGFLLLISVLTIPQFLNMIPLASLACILLVLGYKLAKPSLLKRVYRAGWHEFVPFFATLIGVVSLDLLKGVGVGVVVALICRIKKTDGAVITEQERSALTPTQLVELLKEGNKRFVGNLKANRNLLKQVNETSDKQHPFAFVLSCIDSRTSVELIFDQGLGDILSCRIAGNVLNDDILGSMEFGCKAIGVKLIMVLGHSGCGAISGACDDIKMGHLTDLLNKIKPAIKSEKSVHKNRNSKNHEFVEKVAMLNVKEVMHEIPRRSEIVREMIKSGKLVLVGGMYNVATGEVEFY